MGAVSCLAREMEAPENSSPQPKRRSVLKWTAIGLGAGSAGVIAILFFGVRPYLNRNLVPQVETALEDTLDRPVDVGEIDGLLPWQVSFGRTEIEGLVTVAGIDIRTNPIALLLRRPLSVDVEVHRPEVELTQADDGSWILPELQLNGDGGEFPIAIAAADLKIRRGRVQLRPNTGSEIELEQIFAEGHWDAKQTSFDFDINGKLEAGKLQLNGQALLAEGQVNAEASAKQLSLQALANLIPQFPLDPQKGVVEADLRVAWQLETPPNLTGTIALEDAEIALPQLAQNQTISNLNGQFSLHNQTIQIEQFEGDLGSVPFSSEGTVEWSELLDWAQLKLPINAPEESISLLSVWDFTPADRRPNFAIKPIANTSSVNPIAQQPDRPKPGFDVTLTIPQAKVSELLELVDLDLPIPLEGSITSSYQLKGSITNPILEGTFQSLQPGLVDRVELREYSGRFTFANSQFTIRDLSARIAANGVDAGAIAGSGNFFIGDLVQGELQLGLTGTNTDALLALYDASEFPLVLGRSDWTILAQVVGNRINANANWQATGGSYDWSGTAQLGIDNGGFSVPEAQLRIGEGTIDASLVSSLPNAAGVRSLEATIVPQNVPLALVSPNLSGTLNGDIALQARTDALNLAGLRGQGQVELLEVAGPSGNFSSQVAWDGAALTITEGKALDAIAVTGRIPVNPETFAIGPVALTLVANNLALETVPGVSTLPVGGNVSFQGNVTGPLEALQLSADATAESLVVASLAFSTLQGPVSWQTTQGLFIDLVGSSREDELPPDRLYLQTGADFAPESVEMRQGVTAVVGARQDNLLNLEITQLPLSILNGTVPGYFGGTLDSTVAIDLATRTVSGDFLAEQPHWAGLRASRLQSDFTFGNNSLSLSNGQFFLEDSLIEVDGSMILPSDTGSFMRGGRLVRNQPVPAQVDIDISTDNGKLENILTALDWKEWTDVIQSFQIPELGSVGDLQTIPISTWQRSLYDSLFAYAAIVEEFSYEPPKDARIPDLAQLRGDFQADIRVVGLLTNPIAQVDFQGQNWSLEEFQIDELELSGLLRDLELSLTTFTAKTENRTATVAGKFGLDAIDGSIRVDRFPVELLHRFTPNLPAYSGDLTLTSELGGRFSDPKIDGELRIDNASLNQQPLYAIEGSYGYRDSVLDLNGRTVVNSENIDNPAKLVGRIPYQLPFSTVPPASNELALQISASDGELGFVNLLTDAISLQNPKGSLDIDINGRVENSTVEDLTLKGSLVLNDSTLDTEALPEPLTALDTKVSFNFDSVHVESFSANFSGGTLSASGFLPVDSSHQLRSGEDPLAITIDPLEVEIPDLYKGIVAGNVGITGHVLAPRISGKVDVRNGYVDLSPKQTEASVSVGIGPYKPSEPVFQPQFDGLKIVLGEGLDLGWSNLFRFSAMGDLALYGPLDRSLAMDGTVRLTRGAITAGPIFMRLDRAWPNTAEFSRENGLDPELNIRLTSRGSDVEGTFDGASTNEVVRFTGQLGESGFSQSGRDSSIQTIEVRATVQGPASRLQSDGLESPIVTLSSVPQRSEGEIIAILGNNVFNNFVRGIFESTLAESTYGTNRLGDVIGLDEVNIGTFVGEKNETSLGLEVVKDLGAGFSVSGEGSLTNQDDENPRMGARYRIRDNLILRGRSDFNDDTRGGIEFQTRF